MTQFKLANVLLRLDEHLRRFPEMLYRAEGAVDYRDEDGSLAFEGSLGFLTYFNALSAAKWQRYTGLTNARLHLELVGDACSIQLMGIEEGSVDPHDAPGIWEVSSSSLIDATVEPKEIGGFVRFGGSAEYQPLCVDIPLGGMTLIGFELSSEGATAIRNAYWVAEVPEGCIRDVRIAIATTTFKNEAYILSNIDMVKREVLSVDEPVARGLHMFVVDNGRTLDIEALSDEGVTVIPNPNEGGSAGFARGMMAALESDESFTHVLLMDDDVRISPESIVRTYNLLSLVTDQYAGAFVNGAMLEMENPSKQFEDVSHVRPDGVYRRIKGELYMDTLIDVAMNETLDVEVPNAYGAWWFSCVPLSAIQEHGLPLPVFVRCDDVEFGVRAQPTYMTMNGICVWHASFMQKFRGVVDCYQYIRNYMIMNALHGISNEGLTVLRNGRTVQLYLRAMAYETAELMVEGLEDYLKGPEWLMAASGERILKEKSAKAEKMVPLQQALEEGAAANPELAEAILAFEPDRNLVCEDQAAGHLLRLWRSLPYDRHRLPDELIKDEVATAYYGGYTILSPEQVGKRVLVACDRDCETAHVRVMDRDRWRAIRRRWNAARDDHKKRGAEVAQAYRDALPEMTSVEYWKRHLGEMPS